tara:strand:+ start:66 stop:263 length:198 start_codon:yes stop_codon:yes gene_type:complete
MGLQKDVENRMGESVDNLMTRNAVAGKTIKHCSMLMDVSYSTAHRWANKYSVKFSQYNRTKWKFR